MAYKDKIYHHSACILMRPTLRKYLFISHFICFILPTSAQIVAQKQFSRADSLSGQQSPERTAYDIKYYHLDIRIDPAERYISGQNLFRFTATRDFSRLQFDLFENMHIDKVLFKNRELPFIREFNAVFIDFPEAIKKGSQEEFTVVYSGKPREAISPPWDGGFIFKEDLSGNPWVAVAVQGLGASVWWPNKDQQLDEVDSMMISVEVPDSLVEISNGQFRGAKSLSDGYTRYEWFVSYPINNYNVTVNIGDYIHIKDSYFGEKGKLALDYYLLRENQRNVDHFYENVPQMLTCFEDWLGPYPFYRDGYKLIEAPYLGMEHQSAIAYGNQYKNGYLGNDNSGTGYGQSWDFIIIHESAHEWFGNNITAKDIADSWIHESFTTYAEAIFVECHEGKKAATAYIKGLRNRIHNKLPMLGHYGVNDSGPPDIYYKGANLLQTIRTVINDDKKWRDILQGLNRKFYLQTVTTQDIISYINKVANKDLTPIFNAYLHHASIPKLVFKLEKENWEYRWDVDEKGFNLPVKIMFEDENDWTTIHPHQNWQSMETNKKFVIDTDDMYFDISFQQF